MSLTIRQQDVIAKNFITHLNYAKCMNGMTHALSINIPINQKAHIDIDGVRRFIKLANLTNKSIKGEVKSCHDEVDYVQVVAAWIAVKCYYRIYYLESVLIHLASGADEVFKNGGHHYVRKTIRTYCKTGYVTSKLNHAEIIVDVRSALNHRITAGANLGAQYYLSSDCVKSVRHKIAEYGVQHWKKNQKHKNYRGKTAKADLAAYISRSEVGLLDYFYQMRLKANYRDVEFLNFDVITPQDGLDYIDLLKSSTDKYCRSLEVSIVKALKSRNLTVSNIL